MEIYDDLINLKIEIVRFHQTIIVDLQPIIDQCEKRISVLEQYKNNYDDETQRRLLSIRVLKNKLELLREYQNEIIYYMNEFQKTFEILKKDISEEKLSLVRTNISTLQAIVFNTLNLLTDYFLKNRYVENIHNTIIIFVDKNRPLISEIYKKTLKKLDTDTKIISPQKSDLKTRIKEFFGVSHIHRIDIWKEINGRRIVIRFVNNVDFTKKLAKGKSVEEYIDEGCNSILEKHPELETNIEKIRISSVTQHEQDILSIIKETFLDVVSNKPELIRKHIKKITVELVYDNSMTGGYKLYQSNSDEIKLVLSIYTDVVHAFIIGQHSLNRDSSRYRNIIHELTHAYDYVLNNNSIEDNSIKIIKKIYKIPLSYKDVDFSERDLMLAAVLTECRNEGFARLNELFNFYEVNKDFTTIKLGLRLNRSESFKSSPINNNSLHEELIELAKKFDSNELDFSKEMNNFYDSGFTHVVGMQMSVLIFLESTNGKFQYSRYIENANNIFYPTISHTIIEEILLGQIYLLRAETSKAKSETEKFINKLSLTPPELFLEKYEATCKNFGIEPIISKKLFSGKYSKTNTNSSKRLEHTFS